MEHVAYQRVHLIHTSHEIPYVCVYVRVCVYTGMINLINYLFIAYLQEVSSTMTYLRMELIISCTICVRELFIAGFQVSQLPILSFVIYAPPTDKSPLYLYRPPGNHHFMP